jgi:predicted Zn-dependent protease
LLSVAQNYAEMGASSKLEAVLLRLRNMAGPLLEKYQANPDDVPVAFQLISVYIVSQQTNEAIELLDQVTARPNADANTLLSAAQAYAELQQPGKLEATLKRLLVVIPDNPEAWYDLAMVQVALGKDSEAMQALLRSVELSRQRLARQPDARDLRAAAAKEPRFNSLRQLEDFQQMMRIK